MGHIRRRLPGDRHPRCIIIDRHDRPGRLGRPLATSRRQARSTEPFDISLLRRGSTREGPGRPIALRATVPSSTRITSLERFQHNKTTALRRDAIADISFSFSISYWWFKIRETNCPIVRTDYSIILFKVPAIFLRRSFWEIAIYETLHDFDDIRWH